MKKGCSVLLFVMALLTIGCKSQAVEKETDQMTQLRQTEASEIASEIAGEWELVAIKFRQMTDETLEDLFPLKKPFLVIDTEAMIIFGNNGCNVYRGPIKSITATTLVLNKGLASTLKYCSGVKPLVYMQALGEAKEYKVEKEHLLLQSKDQEVYLKFKKIKN
ncbi:MULTISPECIES: META domain-containing protein [unclassified Myroides]|uniref:META domain-containing protein n=1 Tax=unclassified Myroides TaxID=2642485 RepID=UPI003D2F6E16